MAVNLRKLAVTLDAGQVRKLARGQPLASKHKALEDEEKKLTKRLDSIRKRTKLLEQRMNSLLGGRRRRAKARRKNRKRKVSKAAKRRMAAAQRKRWAKIRAKNKSKRKPRKAAAQKKAQAEGSTAVA